MPTTYSDTTSNTESPQFAHDCACCNFLGRHLDPETSQSMDLYVHTSGSPTVIARTGELGDYMSGLTFSYGAIAPLTEARRRAEHTGLLQYDLYCALAYSNPDDSSIYTELRQAIATSQEWSALLSFEAGDMPKSRLKVNILVDALFEKEKARAPDSIRENSAFDVTRRLDKMLQIMRNNDPIKSLTLAHNVTAFVWERPPSIVGEMPTTL